MDNQTCFSARLFPTHVTLKARHFEPIEHNFLSNGWKMSILPCNPFPQNFKILKLYYDFDFHQVHPMNMYFHRRHVFVLQKVWNQLYDFMHSFWFLKKKVWSKVL
jgi:hypothetical protein